MKTAIVALLAGSAAAFAPASVNKVRSHPFDWTFSCRSNNDFVPRAAVPGWLGAGGRKKSSTVGTTPE